MKKIKEKLFFYGKEKLSDYELLSLSLGDSQVSEKLITTYGSLSAIHQASFQELQKIQGMNKSRIAKLQATLEINRRIHLEKIDRGKKLVTSKDVFEVIWPILKETSQEIFLLLPLDSKNRLIHSPITISTGSIVCTIVHPREVILHLINLKAVSGIIAHNHPSSNDPQPSEEDIDLSKRLKSAGEIMGIQLLDHIVVGNGTYVSFADENLW